MATLFRERIFYTWIILDLLTQHSELSGAKATCPLYISSQHIVLEYGQSINMECHSSESNARLSWTISNIVFNVNTLEMNSTLLMHFLGWNGKASCHGHFVGLDDCQKDLNVTIYKRPDQVSTSTWDHADPMIEGNNYTLQCDIYNVAPVQFLTVNWYKGQVLVESESFDGIKNPANISTTLKFSPNRNDTKIQFSCEAELKLGPKVEKVKSDPLNKIVHSKPIIKEKLPLRVPVFRGYPQDLVCEASGYPEPTIEWIFNDNRFEGGNLRVEENAGKYTCIASNSLGNDTREVNVVLEEDYLPLIAGFVALVVVIISVFFISIYSIYYKNTKMGHYTVEGAKPKAQNGNIAQNGKDGTIPMKKLMV